MTRAPLTRGIGFLVLCLVALCAHADPFAEEEKAVLEVLKPARAIATQAGPEKGAVATHEALEALSKRFGPTHWSRAYALDDLARIEFQRRNLEEAQRVSAEAEAIAQSSFGPQHPRVAYFHSTQAYLDYASGTCTDAEQHYAAAYEIYRRSEGEASERARATATTLANLLIIVGDTTGAERLIVRAFPQATADTDARYWLLQASVATSKGEFADARTKLQRAAAIAERSKSPSTLTRTVALERARLDFTTSDLAGADRVLNGLQAAAGGGADLEVLHLRALVDGLRGRFPEAQAGYRRVLEGYQQQLSELAPPMAIAHYNLAWTYRLLGDYSRSLLYFEKALKGAQQCMGAQSALVAAIYLERSALYLEVGRLGEALADAERGLQIAQQPSFDPVRRAYAVATRGFALKRVGRLDEARTLFHQSVESLAALEGPDASDLAPGYVALAEMALLGGQNAEVIESAGNALRIRRKHGAETFWGSGVALSLLAAAHANERQWPEYWQWSAEMRTLVLKRLRIGPGSSELVQRELRNSRELVERVLDAAPDDQDPSSATHHSEQFETMQLPHLSALSSLGGRLTETLGAQQPGLRELLTERTRVQEDLQAARAHLEGAVSPTRPSVSSEETERELVRVAQLEAQVAALSERLQRQFPRAADLMSPAVESAASIVSRLGGDEALYLQVVTEHFVHSALLTREGVSIRRSPTGRSVVRRYVAALRRALDLGTPLPRRLPFDHAMAHELYESTIGQFKAELAGKTELYVMPDDALQSLPFGVLVTDAVVPASSATTPRGHFLIERYAITVLPSVGALHPERGRTEPRGSLPFIGFGNPVLAGQPNGQSRSPSSLASQSASGVVLEDLNSLSELPQTGLELKELARVLKAPPETIHAERQATETAVKSTPLEPYRVVSFATHGLMAGEFRGLAQPALVLTPPNTASALDDGLLTASEVVQLRLNADIVLLSACNTGRDDAGGGALGLSALARAFLYAGARSVVISHWAVSSDATVPLLSKSVDRMVKAGITKSRALQQSMVEMLAGQDGAQFREPAFWAPFVLVGENAPTVLRAGSETRT